MTPANLAAIRRRLLGWYETHKRDLPWRRTVNPYAIWIAETMLQQTQVSTVVPYYERFMKTFPNVNALGRAPLAKVLALWSGLGYYRRAENLTKSARILARRHRGHLPDDYGNLRALPGVGEYTAGALLSIAFNQPYPAVDGNARRVLSRIFLLTDEAKLRNAASKLVPRSKPGQFNQSLMELGRVLCTPKSPRCVECPVEELCATRTGGTPSRTRAPYEKRPKTRAVTWPVAIVRRGEKLLLRRREAIGILAGLWELPGGEKRKHEKIQTVLENHLPGLESSATKALRLGEIGHAITTRRIRAPVFIIELAPAFSVRFDSARWRWVTRAALDLYPTSSMTRKAVKLLANHEKSRL
jgi:A/G-specific adenine glycosylase